MDQELHRNALQEQRRTEIYDMCVEETRDLQKQYDKMGMDVNIRDELLEDALQRRMSEELAKSSNPYSGLDSGTAAWQGSTPQGRNRRARAEIIQEHSSGEPIHQDVLSWVKNDDAMKSKLTKCYVPKALIRAGETRYPTLKPPSKNDLEWIKYTGRTEEEVSNMFATRTYYLEEDDCAIRYRKQEILCQTLNGAVLALPSPLCIQQQISTAHWRKEMSNLSDNLKSILVNKSKIDRLSSFHLRALGETMGASVMCLDIMTDFEKVVIPQIRHDKKYMIFTDVLERALAFFRESLNDAANILKMNEKKQKTIPAWEQCKTVFDMKKKWNSEVFTKTPSGKFFSKEYYAENAWGPNRREFMNKLMGDRAPEDPSRPYNDNSVYWKKQYAQASIPRSNKDLQFKMNLTKINGSHKKHIPWDGHRSRGNNSRKNFHKNRRNSHKEKWRGNQRGRGRGRSRRRGRRGRGRGRGRDRQVGQKRKRVLVDSAGYEDSYSEPHYPLKQEFGYNENSHKQGGFQQQSKAYQGGNSRPNQGKSR